MKIAKLKAAKNKLQPFNAHIPRHRRIAFSKGFMASKRIAARGIEP
jgi:hypothetical protein